MSINRVTLTGNLTRDPELRSTSGGMSILKLRMAVNDRRKNAQSGEWEDVANYVDVTVFGSRGESLARFLAKGSKIGVDGKLRWSEWENQQGEKRSKIEVVADDIEFLDSRGSGSGNYTPPSDAPSGDTADDGGEEIPF
jgi:single-strand DNA-binding protein